MEQVDKTQLILSRTEKQISKLTIAEILKCVANMDEKELELFRRFVIERDIERMGRTVLIAIYRQVQADITRQMEILEGLNK